jgi:uncharacterized protein YndB with AHSA1/START domain
MSKPMKLRARVGAPVQDVRTALTDPAALRTWFAEHAEVEPPDRFAFWGRYTPEGDAPHQRLLHLDDRTLRFAWLLDGTETTVEIGLTEQDEATTILELSQTHVPGWAEMLAQQSVRSVLHTFWALALANLIDHVEGRDLTARVDLTSPQLNAEVVIDAPPAAVYDSLVDPAKFSRWFGARVEIEPFVGGRFAMGGFELDEAPGKVVTLEPGQAMTVAWEDMVFSWELAGSAGKTRLTFVQSGFDPQHPQHGTWMGWLGGVAELRRFHEVPDWRPVWLDVELEGMPAGMLTY